MLFRCPGTCTIPRPIHLLQDTLLAGTAVWSGVPCGERHLLAGTVGAGGIKTRQSLMAVSCPHSCCGPRACREATPQRRTKWDQAGRSQGCTHFAGGEGVHPESCVLGSSSSTGGLRNSPPSPLPTGLGKGKGGILGRQGNSQRAWPRHKEPALEPLGSAGSSHYAANLGKSSR